MGGHADILEEAEGVGYCGELFGFACGVVSCWEGYGRGLEFAYPVVAAWEDFAFWVPGLVCYVSFCR